MLPINIPDQHYTLSLDSVDLNFLSQYIERPANERRLLWSKPFMNEDPMYCEVQIPIDVIEEEEPYIELSKTYLCHICNIDVPLQYSKQHNRSRRHQNYKQLTEKVMENVLKQINIEIDYANNSNTHDKFYCDTCSRVILVKNKRQHNKSRYHMKSIENQKLDEIFIESYVANKEDGKNCENSGSDTDWDLESESDDEPVTSDNHIICINDVFPSTSGTQIKNDNLITINTGNEVKGFQQYLKDMMTKYKLSFDIPALEDDCIIIVTPKGYKEKITIEAFHSYTSKYGFIYCQLCSKYLKDGTSEHNRTEVHVRNILKPIDDDFTRGVSIGNDWGHCLLCNIITQVSNHTALSTNHKINIATEKLPILLKTPEIPNIDTECNGSNGLNADNQVHDFQQYLRDMISKYDLSFNIPDIEDDYIIIVTPEGHKEKITTVAFHSYTSKYGFEYCQLCRQYTEGFASEHSRTEVHVKNILQSIDDDFIRETNIGKGWGHCLICNTITEIANHAALSPNHKNTTK